MDKKHSVLSIIWFSMIVIATVTAAYTGKMDNVTRAIFESAKGAVTLAISLIGPMALWLGIMKVVEAGGLMKIIARAIRPVMIRLFPDVPEEHPAMSAMIMNIAANILGLGNAATPMGIKAMKELDTLNPEKGTATNAMCLFLAINTSSVTLLPLGVITIRASAGASNPSSILLTTLFATTCSTAVAIIAAKLMARKQPLMQLAPIGNGIQSDKSADDSSGNTAGKEELIIPGIISKTFVFIFIALFIGAIVMRVVKGGIPPVFSPPFLVSLSHWLMPVLMCSLLVFGFFKGVKIYETLTDGAKEGFNIAIRIIPFMTAIFVAIGMFRESGAFDILVTLLNPVTSLIGMPAEALSVALLRPLSGTGSFGVMSEIITKDPDGFLSYLVSTLQGSSETTFYVLAVYFGSIGIKRTRHALPAGLFADAAGVLASIFICRLLF